MSYKTPEEYQQDLPNEPKQGDITRYMVNDGCDVVFFAQGQDATVPGLTFKFANGDEINIVLGGTAAVTNVFLALASAVNGQARRILALSAIVHDEVGCQRSHEIMRDSLTMLAEFPEAEQEPLPEGVVAFPGNKKPH